MIIVILFLNIIYFYFFARSFFPVRVSLTTIFLIFFYLYKLFYIVLDSINFLTILVYFTRHSLIVTRTETILTYHFAQVKE